MYISKGKAQGHELKHPAILDLNPVTSFERERIFHLIRKEVGFEVEGKKVLDLFAGSGALGIEALSRGAASADFVDSNPDSIESIKNNLNYSYFLGKGGVFKKDAYEFVRENPTRYDVIFIDPPANFSNLTSLLFFLLDRIYPRGLFVLHVGPSVRLPPLKNFRILYREKLEKNAIILAEKENTVLTQA